MGEYKFVTIGRDIVSVRSILKLYKIIYYKSEAIIQKIIGGEWGKG